jgi:hypothetical protein
LDFSLYLYLLRDISSLMPGQDHEFEIDETTSDFFAAEALT